MFYSTPLTVLETAAAVHSTHPAFRIPRPGSKGSSEVGEWSSISFAQFNADVEQQAHQWTRVLAANKLPLGAVVSLWLGGMAYLDVVHIYSVMRAGYVPQLFSLRLPNPDIVYELMRKASAQALIYDTSLSIDFSGCPVPTHKAVFASTSDNAEISLPDIRRDVRDTDVAIIFHTSGSTSGSPKLVRCNYRWLNCAVRKSHYLAKPKDEGRHDVLVWMGSMCHIAQTFTLLGSVQRGSCTIQPTQINFSSEELVDMVTRCGLNRLNQFATFLTIHLTNARNNKKLLAFLQSMDEIVYSGLPLAREDEDWAYSQGLPIKNLFGNTECGAMLCSIGGKSANARALRPIEGTTYAFIPITPASSSGHVDANSQLKELVILAESDDCPDPSLRGADGHYHTGDLFLEVSEGEYMSRGRDDDWIKSQNSLRCDTKAIEDNARAVCTDLISECIVVGNGRPSPALFVESKVAMNAESLKRAIIRRIRPFHNQRLAYLHEKITDAKFVFVVPPGTLPRTATKGNIRRKAVEEAFKVQLDAAYASV